MQSTKNGPSKRVTVQRTIDQEWEKRNCEIQWDLKNILVQVVCSEAGKKGVNFMNLMSTAFTRKNDTLYI